MAVLWCITRGASRAILLHLARSCGKKRVGLLTRRCGILWASRQSRAKRLSEMARDRVADFERDFDEAAGCFADQLLRLQHALSGHELQRRHPRGPLEHAREMERAQLRQLSQRLD